LAARVWLSLRPEALRFAEEAPAGWPRLTGTVSRIEMLGPLTRLDVVLANGTVLKMATLDAPHHALAVTAAVALAYHPAPLVVLPWPCPSRTRNACRPPLPRRGCCFSRPFCSVRSSRCLAPACSMPKAPRSRSPTT